MTTEREDKSRGFDAWWFVCAGILALVVIAFVVILVVAGNRGPSTSSRSAAPAASTSAGPTSTGSSDGGGCSQHAANQDIPVIGPSATWKSDGYFRYPTSSTYGPVARSKSDEWGCFQHSPTGALFAAAYFVDGAEFRSLRHFIAQAAFPGEAADAWVAAQSNTAPAAQDPTTVPQIAGYQLRSIQPDAVTVSIALVLGGYRPNGVTIALRWDAGAGTWKVDLGNTTQTAPEQIELTSYTPWSAK